MQPKRKSNSVVTTQHLESGAIRFDVLGAGSVTFDPTKADPSNRTYAETHGWVQRISDAAAISRDPETGKPASPADKLAAMQTLVDHYESGSEEWSRVGQGGGGKSLTIEAIARIKGMAYDVAEAECAKFAEAKFGGDSKKALAYLRTGERVAREMEAMRRERAPAPKIDADKALDEIA
jgi:hypothetical protein